MKPQYCLPIIQKTTEEVKTAFASNIDEYTYFEIWLDYIDDLSAEFVTTLIKTYEKKLIFLFRRKNFEKPRMEESLQEEIIAVIAKSQAYIDIDIEQQKELVESIKQKQLTHQLIASYHEYSHTPADEILSAVVESMKRLTPAIYKISTFCKTPDDALRLLKLQRELKKSNKRCIILGMGNDGMITRIFGTLWGNEMIFAPKELKEASAPGQLTKQQLEVIFATIEGKEHESYGR